VVARKHDDLVLKGTLAVAWAEWKRDLCIDSCSAGMQLTMLNQCVARKVDTALRAAYIDELTDKLVQLVFLEKVRVTAAIALALDCGSLWAPVFEMGLTALGAVNHAASLAVFLELPSSDLFLVTV